MKAAKGAAMAILTQANLRRYHVAMVAFRDKTAQVVLSPTASLALARKRLQSMPSGGATPFAAGLMKAWRLIRSERLKDHSIEPLMVVISDGGANVVYDDHSVAIGVMAEMELICRRIGTDRIHSIVIDTRSRSDGAEDMAAVSRWLNGAYHHVDDLRAGHVIDAVAAHRSSDLSWPG
jgi:magnesium chelatase subunit D